MRGLQGRGHLHDHLFPGQDKVNDTPRFRGWWVLSGLFMVYAASNGIIVHSLPLMYPYLIDEFGWTQVQVTLPATVLLTVSALTSPPVGVMLDRYSSRILITVGAALAVSGLCLHAAVQQLWHMVAAYVTFALALSLSGVVANMFVLSRWFRRLHGRASGILLMASSVGGTLFPLVLGYGMTHLGWRTTLLGLALITAFLMVLPVVLLVRDRPEDFGTGPDGDPLTTGKDDPSESVARSGPTLREALKSTQFYVLAIGTAAVWFTVLSLMQHQSIYLAGDLGVSRSLLPMIFSSFFAASIVGKLAFGLMGDWFRKDRVMIGSILLLMVGLGLLRHADSDNTSWLFLYAVIAGAGFSGAFTSIQVLLAHLFAGPSFGKILASLVLFDTLAGALGTRLVGRIRDEMGSYLPAIDLMMALCALAIICVLMIRFRSVAPPMDRSVTS